MRTDRATTYIRHGISLSLVLFFTGSLFGQGQDDKPVRRSWGYVFGGAILQNTYKNIPDPPYAVKSGTTPQFSSGGFGWEWLTYKGLGVGLEGAGSSSLFHTSLSFSYHVMNLPRLGPKFAPFATTGGQLAWGAGDGGVGVGYADYFVGAGVNLWLHRRVAPRFEVRKYGNGSGISGAEFRLGVSFR